MCNYRGAAERDLNTHKHAFTAPRGRKVCSHSAGACLGSDCVLSLCGMSQAGRAGSRFHWQEASAHPFLGGLGVKLEDAAVSKKLLTSGGLFLTLVLTWSER